jgi:iron complex outermembrane receptor protein
MAGRLPREKGRRHPFLPPSGASHVFFAPQQEFGARPTGGQYPINFHHLPYSGFSPFGFNGRFLYGRVSVEL